MAKQVCAGFVDVVRASRNASHQNKQARLCQGFASGPTAKRGSASDQPITHGNAKAEGKL